jgi:hypothetical protein
MQARNLLNKGTKKNEPVCCSSRMQTKSLIKPDVLSTYTRGADHQETGRLGRQAGLCIRRSRVHA